MTSVEKGVMDPLGYRAHANPESSDSKPSDCLKQETDKQLNVCRNEQENVQKQYNDLFDKHNQLIDKYNVIHSDYNALRTDYSTLHQQYELNITRINYQSCINI